MRQLPADKYNVAWFKLAEFVVRGEKERALGLYRLLIHSFDDRALAYQLEGDLLLSFHDQEAPEKYAQAALLYEKQGRFMEAMALYEHIIALNVQSDSVVKYAKKVIDVLLATNDGAVPIYLAKLKAIINENCYQELCTYLDDIKKA